MELADIIQIIIGFLTLIATITVSFSIYWLQMRHEKESKRIELERKAEKFLFDNEEERDYLPLCVFANNLHRHEKHTREIYKNFCRCSEELQNEILKQAGFSIKIINGQNWIRDCFYLLNKDIEKYKLGRDVLYDGAKYFHKGFEYYRNKTYDIGCEAFCERIYKLSKSSRTLGISNCYTVNYYIGDYFDFIEGKIEPERLNNNNPQPPIDWICEYYDWAGCDEKTACGCTIFIVKNIAEQILYLEKRNDNKLFDDNIELDIETYEDAYYEALFWLYLTYYQDSLKLKK